jgi:class 3 adenylate cyclase
VVNKFSGDVIKFCGDAIIVLWPLDQNCDLETQSLAVELALKCSLQLLRICGRYDKNLSNDRPPVSLRLHCGVGCGYIHSMCLGSGDRWEFLIAGSPLKQVGIAASEAGIGEVCISREVEDLLPDTFQLEKMPLGSYKILGMRNRISNDLSSSFFLGDSDAIRKTSSGQSPARPSVSADSVLESNEQKSPSFGTVALVKGISGRFLLNLQKKDGPPEPRNSGQNRSLVIAAAQMAAIWATAQDTLNTRASRRRSATVAPSEDILDVTRNSHTIAYLDAPMATNAHSSLSNAILDEIPDPVGFAQRLRFFVQDGARDAIEQNCLSYLAELRMVVTMFIEILDLEGDFSQGLLHRPQFVICSILNCLTRFGGSLRQYVIDDKGCLAIAAFGLSGSSHEDNSIRAIETALRIRHLLNHEGISVRFGITSGKVYCGLVGTGDRCEYAMMGSSVNLAARFMANAPANEMIVSHEIYIETFHEFEYNHLTKILAKGYEHPVPAYSPTKRISGNVMKKLHTTHSLLELKDMNYFIGRSPSLAILHAGYQLYLATPETAASSATTTATSTGVASTTTGGASATTVPVTTVSSGIFSILGPPGYGKTWLLNKFLKDISTASASGLSSPPPIKHIYSIVAEEATATKRYHCLRLLFEQILSQEFEGKFSLYNPQGMTSKALLSQQNSISSNVSSPVAGVSYRKLVSGSRSILYSSVQEDNGTEHFTNLFKKWLEIHCPKLMMKDLKIGREIYESEASNANGSNWKRASLSSPQTDEMVTDRGNLNHVTEVLSRHTLIIDLLPCLEGILPIESSFSPIVSSMSHWARIKLSHQIILRVLEMAVLKKGIILTLENLQWCDMPTLDILHLLLSSNKSSPVFFLITARSITSNKEIQQEQDQQQQSSLHSRRSNNSVPPLSFSASPSSSTSSWRLCRSAQLLLNLSKRCVLEPFTTLDIKEMIELILTQQANPDVASSSPASTSPKPSTSFATTTHYHDLLTAESLHRIQQRTGGVPYLTSSLMMSLRESLAHKNFHGIDSLPTGEHNIIVNRFDKLTSTEQLILKVATVIGDTFCFDFLSQVLRHMGNGLASASIGLDSTFQRLQSSSLVVQLVQDTANSSRTMSQAQCCRGTGDEILPYQSFDDPSTDPHHFASSPTPPDTSQLCFQFTARNIKDCIYNLMLQSQRESVHAIVGGLLERQWGTLPELNFFEIAKHYYASNNFQKKIAYLEETLRRAHGDNEPELMKDSLHHLLLITVGYDGDSLIQHAFSTTKSKSSPTLLHLSPAPTAPGAAPGVGEDEEPLLSRWLTMKNLQHPLCLLEGINQTQSQKAMTDPFAVSYHDREISSAAVATPSSAGATQSEKHVGLLSEKTHAHLSNTLSSPGKPTDQGFGDDLMMPSYSSSSKLITMKNVLSWISQLTVVQFGYAPPCPCPHLSPSPLPHPFTTQVGELQTHQQPRDPVP